MGDSRTEILMSVLRPLLLCLESLALVGRHVHPANIPSLLGHVGEPDRALAAARAALGGTWPQGLGAVGARIDPAADAVMAAFAALRDAVNAENPVFAAYRGLRRNAEALEVLYPLAGILPPVNWFFLDAAARDDATVRDALLRPPEDDTGLMYAGGDENGRGAWLYVPEYYTPDRPWPLVMALHGGSGTGRSFIWSWLRDARSRGAILLAPTSAGQTWSITGEDMDSPAILELLEAVRGRWTVDPARMLLTGMSDGGTFSYVSGLDAASPFTHLAPVSAAFHPMLAEFADGERLRGLPMHIVHGALDWMFPVDMARMAAQFFTARGAAVTLREVADLPHCYPVEMNAAILDWFAPVPA